MTNSKIIAIPKAPKELSDEARSLWQSLVRDYAIDDGAGLILLRTACEALDEMRRAQAILDRDGPVIEDRFGQQRQHPATLVVRDSRNALLKALRQLNLDVEPGSFLKSRNK